MDDQYQITSDPMTSARYIFFNSNHIPYHLHSIETHILTPSPYYRGQYLTLDNRVVEIDKEYVKEISGKTLLPISAV